MRELKGLGAALKAIRLKCIDCSNHQTEEIANCPITDCPLYQWRFGKNPNPSRKGNPEAFRRLPSYDS